FERRSSRFDRDNSFDKVWPCVGDEPSERSRLRVCQKNRRSDLVEERRTSVLVALLSFLIRQHGLDLCRIERVEDRIALFALVPALARPLRVLLASRPRAVALDRCELELLVLGGEHPRRTVGWVIGRTTAHWLVDHVDDIALLDKKLGPAFAAIRCSHPVSRR